MRVGLFGIGFFAACALLASAASGAGRDLRLIAACQRDDLTAAKALTAAGANVNAPAPDGSTALHWAAQADDLALADLLIGKGAKVNAQTDLDITPLWIAATNASAPMVKRLLDAGANPNLAPATDGTPLMIAAQRGAVDAVKALLAHGADPNAREAARGQTALMWAVSARHPEVVRLLLQAHADVRARSRSWTERVLLCCQFYEGDEAGAAVLPVGGYTPLLFAAQDGDVDSARLLVAAGADLNDAAPDGSGALVIAAHAGQTDVAASLLTAGADPNAAGAGYSALHVAATRGDLRLVEALLDHGADPNARQLKGSPTRRLRSGHALDFRLVGATPYILAVRAGQTEVMTLLVARGADPRLTLQDGRSALMVLAGPSTQEGPMLPDAKAVHTVKLAISLGTPVNLADANGDTALHMAATRRRDAVVQALVDSGAAINARNHQGQTPLTAALTPPGPMKGTALAEEYDFLRDHKQTAELLRKLGATT